MLIKSLEQMEAIVKSNKDLSWDGWDVISLKPIDSGLMSKDSVQIDGKWFNKTRFSVKENGWEIPNKLVG
jgi:hypothetical protein